MNLKTYTAQSMADALAMVRQEYGSNAVILHTRTYKRGGFLGLGARNIVEVTAGDGREVGRHRHQAAQRERARKLTAITPAPGTPAPGISATPGIPSGASTATLATPTQRPDPRDQSAGDLIRRTYAAARAELEKSHAAAAASAAATATPGKLDSSGGSGGTSGGTSGGRGQDQLAAEMQAVKRMVAQMMRQQRRRAISSTDIADTAASSAAGGDKLVDQYLALLQQEVAEELADEIICQVRHDLGPKDVADESACRDAVRSALAALLPVENRTSELPRTRDGRPRTIALVGPTGVGKTTTIAKLAATLKLKQNKRVGLITLDTYRIAAVDQLRTYASIIGIPLHVCTSPAELSRALEACLECDAVLIDTAGRSQRDGQRLEELARFIEAASPHEVHLVLSSTCSQNVLMEAIDRFSRIRTDSIIFTKLDEAVSFGVLLNVLRKVNKRLSYITTGQEVPHQIEPGNSSRLAALVMGEGSVQR